MLYIDEISTPVGLLRLIANEKGLYRVCFEHESSVEGEMRISNHPTLLQAKRELREYFGKHRKHFEVPLDIHGTPFQKRTWNELRKIPFGKTISYKGEAMRMGNENAARAVGSVNRKNPLPIFIPCHRVILGTGGLGGYSGGVSVKQYLLEFEKTQHGGL